MERAEAHFVECSPGTAETPPVIGDVTTYYGHVLVHNTYVEYLNPDFTSVETRTYDPSAATAQSLDMTSDGKLAVGSTHGVEYWDADGNLDSDWFVPDEAWGTIDGSPYGFSQ